MAKINDQGRYPEDNTISFEDFLIGSNVQNQNRTRTYSLEGIFDLFVANGIAAGGVNFEQGTPNLEDFLVATTGGENGEGVRYTVQEFITLVQENLNGQQNNTITNFVTDSVGDGFQDVATAINQGRMIEVLETEILHVVNSYRDTTNPISARFNTDYYFLTLGRGTYGQGGETTVTPSDFILIRGGEDFSIDIPVNTENRAIKLYNISAGSIEDSVEGVVNTSLNEEGGLFEVGANDEVFFVISTPFAGDLVNRRAFRFLGGQGSYGEGSGVITEAEEYLFLEQSSGLPTDQPTRTSLEVGMVRLSSEGVEEETVVQFPTRSGIIALEGDSIQTASEVTVEDVADNFTSEDVEGSLAELATRVDSAMGTGLMGGIITEEPNITDGFLSFCIRLATIPEGVTEIGAGVFSFQMLDALILPEGLVTIGSQAFRVNEIKSLILPSSLTTIIDEAFAINQLTTIAIPDSVTTLGIAAFSNNQLTDVTIGNGLTQIAAEAFNDNKLESVTIPDTVTSIGVRAFGDNNITSIDFGSGVSSIQSTAFQGNSLESITFPDTLGSIGTNAFRFNRLTSINFGNGIVSIASSAFQGNDLTGVVFIPDSVTNIGSAAFLENPNITELSVLTGTTLGGNVVDAGIPITFR